MESNYSFIFSPWKNQNGKEAYSQEGKEVHLSSKEELELFN
jgi:hypothetical protein